MIYLDSNAGVPLLPSVEEELRRFLSAPRSSQVINSHTSSVHGFGREIRKYLREAREKIATAFDSQTTESQIAFAQSGTEANQLVLRSFFLRARAKGNRPRFLATRAEHPSTLNFLQELESLGADIVFIQIRPDGQPNWNELTGAFNENPGTTLLTLSWVNNETGVILDLERLKAIPGKKDVALHLDGAQAWGRIPLQAGLEIASWVTASGAKMGALSGSGVVWSKTREMRQSLEEPRSSPSSVLNMLSLGWAASEANPEKWEARIRPTRERFERLICSAIPRIVIHGDQTPRVCSTTFVGFEGLRKGTDLVAALDLKGYAVSAGTACQAGLREASHVLRAMGVTEDIARSSVRVSFFEPLTDMVLDDFVSSLAQVVSQARA